MKHKVTLFIEFSFERNKNHFLTENIFLTLFQNSLKMKKNFFLIIAFFCFIWGEAQHLKLNLDEKGTTFIKASVRANFWARHYQANPHSTINSEPINSVTDFSVRRLRMNFQAQLTPKLFFYSNFGNNDINFIKEKEIRFDPLDLYVEYEFTPEFAFGIGEIGWGSSRGSMRSSKTMMGLDTPLFSLFNVNKNDDLARSLGIFAKGRIGKWSYVTTIKNPIKIKDTIAVGKTDYSKNNPHKQYSAYLKYDFWQPESNKTSYSGGAGTYAGTKKIFNIAVGSTFQAKMMTERVAKNKEIFHDYKNFSAELFLDTPISEKNDAITMYFGYFYTNFGRNYLRNVGANDVADTTPTPFLNGNGNDFPMMGTGQTLFFQGGYLLPKNELFSARIQPHISIQHSNFQRLNSPMIVYDCGVNIFFKGHDRKLTFSYQNRPIFLPSGMENQRKGMFVIQYQIEIN